MFLIKNLQEAVSNLERVYSGRVAAKRCPEAAEVRGPVGLFFVRQDGGAGSKLAEEVVASFGYWNLRSGHCFDGLFMGWGFDGVPAFDEDAFVACVKELEHALNWRYDQAAQLLLTDFVYRPVAGTGHFDFSRSIPLDISGLLDAGRYSQLAPLMEQLIKPVERDREAQAEVSVMEISDYQAFLEGRRRLWDELVKKFGLLLGWIDQITPFAVRDLRKV